MAATLTFTDAVEYVTVAGNTTYPSVEMRKSEYQLVRIQNNYIHIVPLVASGVDIGAFGWSDVVSPVSANISALYAALYAMFTVVPDDHATASNQVLMLAEMQLKANLTETQPVTQVTLVSTGNSTTTPLNAAAVFTGAWEDVSGYESVTISVATDQDGTFTIQFSPDGTNVDSTLTRYYRTAGINPPQPFAITRKYARVTFTNTSAGNQTYLRLQAIFGRSGLLNIPLDSLMAQNYSAISVRPTDYHYEVAMGLRQGKAHWDIWGNNDDVDIGTEVIRSFGGTAVSNITSATTYTFVSTSANDTSAGTGAKSLVVYYIDSSRKAQIGVVTLNGLVPVVSAFSGLGINRISIYLAGSGQTNAGAITCTETTGAATVAQIRPGEGTNQSTVFYIQTSATALVHGLDVNVIKPAAGTAPVVAIKGWVFSFVSNAKYLVYSKTIDTSIVQSFDGDLGHPFPVGEKSIIWFEATTDQNNTQVSLRYSLTEIKSDSA